MDPHNVLFDDDIEALFSGRKRLHPQDRALLTQALSCLKMSREERAHKCSNEQFRALLDSAQKAHARALRQDHEDLPPPDKLFRRHTIQEPPCLYKSFSIEAGDKEYRAALHLIKPEMKHDTLNNRHEPCHAHNLTEGLLLQTYRTPHHLNYDDQKLVHEALLALRKHKLENNQPRIKLHDDHAAQPSTSAEYYRGGGFRIII
jgi:hypothetical protein